MRKNCDEYEVLKREKEYTKVKIVLHTGRTHQIRPISPISAARRGDTKYGFRRKSAFRAHPTVPRSQESASCCGRGARLFEG
ncbi:MAG: hypothetical protein ACLRSW_00495 [Christensenellaceae bacterium]